MTTEGESRPTRDSRRSRAAVAFFVAMISFIVAVLFVDVSSVIALAAGVVTAIAFIASGVLLIRARWDAVPEIAGLTAARCHGSRGRYV